MRDDGETLHGSPVLEEVEGHLGVLLWQAIRDVMLWGETPAEHRRELFGPLAGSIRARRIAEVRPEPEVELALTPLVLLLRDPEGADEEVVADACHQLASWAEKNSRPSTAIAFAQAAAVARPVDARAAFEVGRLALEAATPEVGQRRAWLQARAETWLRRAVGVARRGRQWHPYGTAYLTLADLYLRAHKPGAAREAYLRALRVARRRSFVGTGTQALRGLLQLAMLAEDRDATERYLRKLLRRDRDNEEAPAAALRDYGRALLVLGEPARACTLLKMAVARSGDTAGKLEGLGLLTRAALESDNQRLRESAWEQTKALLARIGPEPADSAALVEVTRTALRLSDWTMLGLAGRLSREAWEKDPTGETKAHADEAAALIAQAGARPPRDGTDAA